MAKRLTDAEARKLAKMIIAQDKKRIAKRQGKR